MNMKSVMVLVASGLIASFAYIAPVMADDSGSGDMGGDPMQLSDNSPSQDNNSPGNSDASSTSQSSGAASSTDSNSDQGSPDTATGDDDY